MEFGSKHGLIAKAAVASGTFALLFALFMFGPTQANGQTDARKNEDRKTQSAIEKKTTSSNETSRRPRQQVVQFGSSARSESALESNSSIQNLVPTGQKTLRQQAQKNQAAVAQPGQFDGNAAFKYLSEICKIGPRPSASRGMEKQQKYLQRHFEQIGGKYFTQEFTVTSPYNQKQVKLYNLLIRWHPERTKRLLICCHHDTRPFADADKRNPRAKFIGANDGASGVALLCELGKFIAEMDGEYGVDFMFFDGEEFVIVRQRDPMFLGSTFFAQKYAEGKIPWQYEQAILVDMVADKDLQIYLEGNSMHYAKGLTQEVWAVAQKLGVKEFIPQQKQFIRDDHLPMNEIAKIPTCDLIDFDFPNPARGNIFWHTREDKIENCSAESLGKVGAVVLAWLRQKQQPKLGQ